MANHQLIIKAGQAFGTRDVPLTGFRAGLQEHGLFLASSFAYASTRLR